MVVVDEFLALELEFRHAVPARKSPLASAGIESAVAAAGKVGMARRPQSGRSADQPRHYLCDGFGVEFVRVRRRGRTLSRAKVIEDLRLAMAGNGAVAGERR